METLKSQFKRWKAGELTMLGSFQTKLFQAFQIADSENQLKLSEAFPYWFLETDPSEKRNYKKSQIINDTLKQMSEELITEMKKYLDKHGQLEFKDNVNLSYANEEMRIIAKRDGKYLLITSGNSFGEEYSYEIQDQGRISIEDLLWILEQIENKTKGQ